MSFILRNPSSDCPPKAPIPGFNANPSSQSIELSREPELQLSDGEIHYLYWFIQGSIMVPEMRHRLRRAWGFCERHAWGYILVEAAFYRGYMHGSALLYEDLLTPALSAFAAQGPLKNWRLARNLRRKGPCPMCDMGFGPQSKGMARSELIHRVEMPLNWIHWHVRQSVFGQKRFAADVQRMDPPRDAGTISSRIS